MLITKRSTVRLLVHVSSNAQLLKILAVKNILYFACTLLEPLQNSCKLFAHVFWNNFHRQWLSSILPIYVQFFYFIFLIFLFFRGSHCICPRFLLQPPGHAPVILYKPRYGVKFQDPMLQLLPPDYRPCACDVMSSDKMPLACVPVSSVPETVLISLHYYLL